MRLLPEQVLFVDQHGPNCVGVIDNKNAALNKTK